MRPSGTNPPELRYTKDHEWIRVGDDRSEVGITAYAQQQLGDVVFVDLPEVGRSFSRGEQFGSIESVKAVSDLYCPVAGEVVAVNRTALDQPELVNRDPYGTWLIAISTTDPAELASLLDADAYGDLVK